MTGKPVALLRVVEGTRRGDSIPLTCRVGEVWSIGRSLENTVCLTDAEVSRRHATVTFDGGGFTLADNRSTNGTFVNGAFTPKVVLRNGDEIRFGEAVLRFEQMTTTTGPPAVNMDTVQLIADDSDMTATPSVNMTLAIGDTQLRASEPDTQNLAELQTAHERLAILHEVNQAVATAVDQDGMLDQIMMQLAGLKDFDRGFILLYDEAGELQVRAQYERPGLSKDIGTALISRTVLDQVVDDGVAVLCSDLQNDPRFERAESIRLGSVRSVICAPLVAHGEVLGVLHLDSESLHNAFSEHDLRLFTTIANDISIALANQRMRDRLIERQRIEHELEIASQIQQNFLPTHVPVNPKIHLCGRNVPALEVGGDYYDYFNLGDDLFAVVIGDVSGKGVPAAMLMVKAMTEFRGRAVDCRTSTAAAVAELNAVLAPATMRGMFITLAYLVIDTSDLTMQYTNAGHLSPLLLPQSGEVAELHSARGIPVGIMPVATYEEATVTLQPGDTIFLTTDGVTEARNSAKEELGDAQLRTMLTKHRADPDALVAAVVDETLAFVGAAPQHDDITAVAIRVG